MGIIPLHCAAVRGMSDAVKALLKAISNMNEKDKASIIQWPGLLFYMHVSIPPWCAYISNDS